MIERVIKVIIFVIAGIFKYPAKNTTPNTLLLIRLDAIGDYFLFRNFIKIIRTSKQYKAYKITLVGNVIWKELAQTLDGEYIDKFIWIDRTKFSWNIVYLLKKFREITLQGYDTVIMPMFSRELFYADTIVKIVNAREKIGSIGDLSNIRNWQRKISNDYYTKLIYTDEGIVFEFMRNKNFFEKLLSKKLSSNIFSIDSSGIDFDILSKNFVMIFIGASDNFRKWSLNNYALIAKSLIEKCGLSIVICGGPKDIEDGAKLEKMIASSNVINICGKTRLTQICRVIRDSCFVISNETFVPHFAVASKKSVVVISNGNHFGRFVPYPNEMTDKYCVVFPPEIENDIDNYKQLCLRYGKGSDLDINLVSVEKVTDYVKEFCKCEINS